MDHKNSVIKRLWCNSYSLPLLLPTPLTRSNTRGVINCQLSVIILAGVCLEAIGEAKVEWMTSSDIQASDEDVFNYTTVLPIKGMFKQ